MSTFWKLKETFAVLFFQFDSVASDEEIMLLKDWDDRGEWNFRSFAN